MGLIGAVSQSGGLASKHLLADQTVVNEVECELEHPLCRGALGIDYCGPFERHLFESNVVDDIVNGAHGVHGFSVIFASQKEDLSSELLTHLTGQVGRTKPTVKAGHVGVGLLEPCVLATRQG